MKIQTLALSALTAVFLFAGSSQADAAVVNFADYNYNMGTVAAGDSGSIATADKIINIRSIENGIVYDTTGWQHDYLQGVLPSNTQITFTYNTDSTLFAANPYGYFAEGVGQVSDASSIYRAWAASDNGWTYSEEAGSDGIFSATNSTLGLTATAFTNQDSSIATLIITNLSNVAANFESYVFASTPLGSLVTGSYNVSAVPLPAALPLFGLALVGMAGYRRHRKNA